MASSPLTKKRRVAEGAKIRLGSDCAGLMGAALALEELGLGDRVEHVLISEKDPNARAVIQANYHFKNAICKDAVRPIV
eukprot:5649612-Alexandrium_andersonii.AAC.1